MTTEPTMMLPLAVAKQRLPHVPAPSTEEVAQFPVPPFV